jgi:N-acetylmuramoyl-L-alanine amidase
MRWTKPLSGPRIAHAAALFAGVFALPSLLFAQAPVTPTPPPAPAAVAPPPMPRYVVVLDAAHGGDDTGGRLASGAYEKAVTLNLSVRLRSLLNARGITVVTTRESDTAVEPERRAGIANHAKAAACLSLHVTETGAGIHLFTSSLAPAQPEHFIAWKTAQAPWITRSLALEGSVNSALQHAGMNITLSRTALIAVDSMTCPAVAIEVAPERGPDGKVTAEPDDPEYLARVATTLANAMVEWRTDAGRTEGH